MTRLISLGRRLAALALCGLAACGGNTEESTRETASSTRETATETTGAKAHDPDSAAAALIAFAAGGESNVVSPRGDGLRELTEGPEDDFSPSWSASGRAISFRRATGGGPSSIYEVGVATRTVKNSSLPEEAEGLTWSPDGRLVAYSGRSRHDVGGRGDIVVVDPDGSNPRRAGGWPDSTDERDNDREPRWLAGSRGRDRARLHAVSDVVATALRAQPSTRPRFVRRRARR